MSFALALILICITIILLAILLFAGRPVAITWTEQIRPRGLKTSRHSDYYRNIGYGYGVTDALMGCSAEGRIGGVKPYTGNADECKTSPKLAEAMCDSHPDCRGYVLYNYSYDGPLTAEEAATLKDNLQAKCDHLFANCVVINKDKIAKDIAWYKKHGNKIGDGTTATDEKIRQITENKFCDTFIQEGCKMGNMIKEQNATARRHVEMAAMIGPESTIGAGHGVYYRKYPGTRPHPVAEENNGLVI